MKPQPERDAMDGVGGAIVEAGAQEVAKTTLFGWISRQDLISLLAAAVVSFTMYLLHDEIRHNRLMQASHERAQAATNDYIRLEMSAQSDKVTEVVANNTIAMQQLTGTDEVLEDLMGDVTKVIQSLSSWLERQRWR